VTVPSPGAQGPADQRPVNPGGGFGVPRWCSSACAPPASRLHLGGHEAPLQNPALTGAIEARRWKDFPCRTCRFPGPIPSRVRVLHLRRQAPQAPGIITGSLASSNDGHCRNLPTGINRGKTVRQVKPKRLVRLHRSEELSPQPIPVHPRREARRSPEKAPTGLGMTEGIFPGGRASRGLAPFRSSGGTGEGNPELTVGC